MATTVAVSAGAASAAWAAEAATRRANYNAAAGPASGSWAAEAASVATVVALAVGSATAAWVARVATVLGGDPIATSGGGGWIGAILRRRRR